MLEEGWWDQRGHNSTPKLKSDEWSIHHMQWQWCSVLGRMVEMFRRRWASFEVD